ncbi:pyruvate dehydrogenase complex dihydrolipoamide acetyltransferase [Flavimarina sp. Hel_I_48]|uniref:pyruvate dehydrogenase complex dihydrolipoamide acetyltransferase n=1 Tax=Flavimarina sp. Hel_I_48 TaxID=1392488 RepID=UPI0004DFBE67|nr:pyruvate dehydrogenase complex dihydrolipoamide acetyltransferase [Flavimarina sp. Hel_I_48]
MAEVIKMPRLSDTMEEGTVASWLKKKGDKVQEGDILAEIETDKATMEFESFHEGTLLYIGIEEGETAKVDKLLAIIGEEDEDISDLISGGAASEDSNDSEEDSAEDDDSTDEDESDSDDQEEKSDAADSDEDESEDEEGDEEVSDEIPDGVEVVKMPRLSDTMEEGTVASWLKKEGDEVSEGDILAEIETDKATMEFESFYAGTLLHIGIQEGETAKVDSLLAIIGPEGTDVSGIIASGKSGGSKKSESKKASESKDKKNNKEEKKEDTKEQQNKKGDASKSSDSDKAQKKEKLEAKDTDSSKMNEEKPTSSSDGRLFASPLAKKLAEEKGIDLNKVNGSGDNGRVVRKDIENYTPAASGSGNAVQQFVATGEEDYEEVKNSQMRKAIAKGLSKSKFSAPDYTLNVEFDMENAIAFRGQFNQLPDTKISYNDMLIKAVALALKQHPQVNSQWFDDKMRLNHHVHMGVAVAVPDGLVVPVVKFANEKTLQQINAEVKELAGKAKNKKLKPEEMQGSTFTVSNLGMFGITSFTSIINQPNSAILSIGTIVQKPVVKDGKLVVGNTMALALTCDHRTVDGATGAKFLQTLKTYIENPILMLV